MKYVNGPASTSQISPKPTNNPPSPGPAPAGDGLRDNVLTSNYLDRLSQQSQAANTTWSWGLFILSDVAL